MKRVLLSALAVVATAAFAPGAAAARPDAQQVTANTWRLPKDAPRPAARIDAAGWLAGQYSGTGLGGEVEYQWLPPRAAAMFGTLRLIKDGRTAFSEILMLDEVGGSLSLRVKHFTPEFVGWEEKDRHIEFKLVAAGAEELRFDALTLRRSAAGGLRIYLAMRRDGEVREEVFDLVRLPR